MPKNTQFNVKSSSGRKKMETAVTRAMTPPNKARYATGTPYGKEAYKEIVRSKTAPDLRSVAEGVAQKRAAQGLPSAKQIREKVQAKMKAKKKK